MTKISIIITSYNQKEYLRQAIESVLAQTLRPYEIIVADDCSSDGSVEMIRGYEARYPGWVKGIYHPQNLGISANRNSAVAIAAGDLMAVLDGDDRYLPQNLASQVEALQTIPQAQCAYSNLYRIDSLGNRLDIRDKQPRPSGDILVYVACAQMGLLRSMLLPVVLARQVGMFNANFPKYDGYILHLQAARQARFAYVFEPLAEYRIHPGGDSHTFSPVKRLDYLQDVYAEVARLTAHLSGRQKKAILKSWRCRFIGLNAMIQLNRTNSLASLFLVFPRLLIHPACAKIVYRVVCKARQDQQVGLDEV
jgi:glycosyltransferase involved in cell wall biosynthesis